MIANKTANEWFAEYGSSHKNKTNKLIHWVAVPVIFLTIIGLMWDIPVSTSLEEFGFNWAFVGIAFSAVFYLLFSARLAVGLMLFLAACAAVLFTYSSSSLAQSIPTWAMSLALFVIAWIFQFIGHKIEGAKPSFFKDIIFLMVGPAFFMGYIYRRLGLSY